MSFASELVDVDEVSELGIVIVRCVGGDMEDDIGLRGLGGLPFDEPPGAACVRRGDSSFRVVGEEDAGGSGDDHRLFVYRPEHAGLLTLVLAVREAGRHLETSPADVAVAQRNSDRIREPRLVDVGHTLQLDPSGWIVEGVVEMTAVTCFFFESPGVLERWLLDVSQRRGEPTRHYAQSQTGGQGRTKKK